LGLRTPSLSRHCRGCGRKRYPISSDKIVALCEICQTLVDRLRDNENVRAVFIFSRGNRTKYYAAMRGPAS
jgi:hypothetical protein